MHTQCRWSFACRAGVGFLVMFLIGFLPSQHQLEAQTPHEMNPAANPPAFQVNDVSLPNPIINQSAFDQFEPSSAVLNNFLR